MRTLPCDYQAGRFLLHVALPTGRTVRLNVDTGGGFVLARGAAVGLPSERTGLAEYPDGVRIELDPPVVDGPPFAFLSDNVAADGVVPAQWFAGRVWTFDHGRGELRLHETDDPEPLGVQVPLGYPSSGGRRTGPFSRITVEIDREAVDLLLDTGATAVLEDSGLAVLGPPRAQSSSFIVNSIATRWRRDHPSWRTIERPTSLAELMIEVPSVRLAGMDLGAVWFETRPDQNFHAGMSRWMDRPIHGALGGNAFIGRQLTLNAPGARAIVH